jgi:hypothetical protein
MGKPRKKDINMTKNMTRKGLAFGAGLALIGSTFAALPAQASAVTLSPSAGTSFNTLTSSTFKLMPILTGLSSADYKYLRYKVTNADENQFRVDIEQGTNGDGELTQQYGTSTAAVGTPITTVSYQIFEKAVQTADGTHATDSVQVLLATPQGSAFLVGDIVTLTGDLDAGTDTISAGTFVVLGSTATAVVLDLGTTNDAAQGVTADVGATLQNQSRTTDDSFVVFPSDPSGSNASAIGSQNYLKMSPVVTSATAVATVQAWIDGNTNNTIDAGEITSVAQTVTWKPVGTLSASLSVDTVYPDVAAVTSAVTFTGDINYSQIDAGDVLARLTETTNAGTALAGNNANVQFAFNTTTGRYQATDDGLTTTTVDSADVLKFDVLVDNDYDGTAAELKATSSVTIATTVANPTFEAMVVDSATAVSILSQRVVTNTAIPDFTTRAGTGAAVEGSTGFSVKLFVGTDATTLIGSAKAPVSVAVTSTNVSATDAVTVGGKKLVTGTATALNVVTDANGFATIAVTLGAADDADTIIFSSSPFGAAVANQLTVTVTDNSADYTVTQLLPGNPSMEVGGVLSIEYKVVDFFGVAPANNTHSVIVAPTANERTKAAVWVYSIPVVDGKAVLTVTDNGTGVGKFTANAKVVLNGGVTALNAEVNTVVNVVADKDAAKIVAETLTYGTLQANDINNDGDYTDTNEVDNTAKLLLESKAFSNYDSRYNVPTVSAPAVRDTYKVAVGGKVTNAAGVAVAGAPVTFSALGFLFSDGTTFAKDSITVHASSTGIASVNVWSSVGGARSVTMTSGTATASQALVFAAGTGTAKSFTVASPAYSAAGTTADVVVTIVDEYGNAAKGVTVSLFSTGPGYLINTTGTTLTNGTFSTKLLLGSNDSGSAVVSAVVTIAGVETTQTATITVGTAPSDTIVNVGSFSGKLVVYALNASGSEVSYKIAGKWVTQTPMADTLMRYDRVVAAVGVTVLVDIYVDGVKKLSKSVVTK